MKKTPNGCKAPSKARDEYALTAADIRFMQKQLAQVWDMIEYYANVPENETGEIVVQDRNAERFDELSLLLEDIKNAIDEVRFTD